MDKVSKIIACVFGLMFSFNINSAYSNGLFDHLDYCIEERRQFSAHRRQMLTAVQRLVANSQDPKMFNDVRNQQAAIQFMVAWEKEMVASMRRQFIAQHGHIIRGSNGNIDVAFKLWWQREGLKEVGGRRGLLKAAQAAFLRMALKEAQRQGNAIRTKLQKEKRSLYERCRPNVVQQVMRLPKSVLRDSIKRANSIFNNSPSGRNFQGARREGSLFDKGVKATTGISPKDARKNLFGGRNSEPRKIGRAIGKVFGW